jgi:hypothetical protein
MDCAERSLRQFFLRPHVRYRLAWLLAGAAAAIICFIAWTRFDSPKPGNVFSLRKGTNYGHATIDFAGQWLMGRMLVLGRGRHLYDRNYLREVVYEAFPHAHEISTEELATANVEPHDPDDLMQWLMGRDDPKVAPTVPQLGGALYPPIHALMMAPFGMLQPASAYRLVQGLGIVLALVAGAGIRLLSQGRIWWPIAVAGVMLFPGFACTLNLGQNSIFLLTLLIWGWVFLACDRPILAGTIWGLLAFKPVWAAAFFLVPILTRRWQVCLAMLLTGLGLAAITLPLVGWQSWVDWLHVGRLAASMYDTNQNWIFLSRDLLNIPRRWLLDFTIEDSQRESLAATVIGWGLLILVVAGTAFLSILRKEQSRALAGPPAAFLLLGAWMSCFHFMYYDILLTALPIALLYRSSCVRHGMTLTLLVLLVVSDLLLPLVPIEVSISAPMLKNGPIPLPIVFSTAYAGTPWPTFCIFALWLWCGWRWLRMPGDLS